MAGLVNAAGIFGKMHTLEKVRMEQWDREVNIDLRGTFMSLRPGAANSQCVPGQA